MNPIEQFMRSRVESTGILEDYHGELHAGKLARVPLPGTTNAHGGETFAYVRRGSTEHLIVLFMGGEEPPGMRKPPAVTSILRPSCHRGRRRCTARRFPL